jgi:DNA-directed RNA polymerase specialized sigma24 family protein
MGKAGAHVRQRSYRSPLDSRDARLSMRDVHETIEAVWKIESPRLIAAIARVTQDIGVAEELARDALVTALELMHRQSINYGSNRST